MPKALIEEMKAGYGKSGLSRKQVNHRVYGHLNNVGAMHGSKETKKGAAMEEKFEKDHGFTPSSSDAADAIEAHLSKKKRRD